MGAGASTTKKKKLEPTPTQRLGMRGRPAYTAATTSRGSGYGKKNPDEGKKFTDTARYEKGTTRVRNKLVAVVNVIKSLTDDSFDPAAHYRDLIGDRMGAMFSDDDRKMFSQILTKLRMAEKKNPRDEEEVKDLALTLNGILTRVNKGGKGGIGGIDYAKLSLPSILEIPAWGKEGSGVVMEADWKQYVKSALTGLTTGKVAIQFFAAGQGAKLYERSGVPTANQRPLMVTEPWNLGCVMGNEEALKRGMDGTVGVEASLGARYLMNVAIAIENLGGEKAVGKVPLIIHVRKEIEQNVMTELEEHNYFGFKRDNVFIVSQILQAGYTMDEGAVRMRLCAGTTQRAAGNGYGLLQLRWDNQAIVFKGSPAENGRVDGPLLDLLTQRGVEWVMTQRIDDTAKLSRGAAIDVGFLAMLMKEHKLSGATCAVEADVTGTRKEDMDVLLGRDDPGASAFGTIIRADKFRSQDGYACVKRLTESNRGVAPPVNTARFAYNIKAMTKALDLNDMPDNPHHGTGNPMMSVLGSYVYPDFKIGDMTGGNVKMLCLSHGKKTKFADLRRKEDIPTLLSYLKAQDNDDEFISYAKFCQYSVDGDEMLRRSVSVVPRLRVALCCMDDKASVDALRMLERLLRPECDLLHLVTVTRVLDQRDLSAAFAVLDLFSPVNRRQEVRKQVLTIEPESTPTEAVVKFTKDHDIDLLVLASHEGVGHFAKNCLVHVLCPMLVVKSGHKQKLVEPPSDNVLHTKAALKITAMVDSHSMPMIEFLPKLMDVRADSLMLILPGERDPPRRQLLLNSRILTTLERTAVTNGMATRSRMVYGEPRVQQVNKVVTSLKTKIFCFRLPKTEVLPEQLLEHLATSTCPVLCFRGDEHLLSKHGSISMGEGDDEPGAGEPEGGGVPQSQSDVELVAMDHGEE